MSDRGDVRVRGHVLLERNRLGGAVDDRALRRGHTRCLRQHLPQRPVHLGTLNRRLHGSRSFMVRIDVKDPLHIFESLPLVALVEELLSPFHEVVDRGNPVYGNGTRNLDYELAGFLDIILRSTVLADVHPSRLDDLVAAAHLADHCLHSRFHPRSRFCQLGPNPF